MIIGRTFLEGRLQNDDSFPEQLVVRGRDVGCPHLPQNLSGQRNVKVVWSNFSRRIVVDEFDRLDVEATQFVDSRDSFVVAAVVVKAANTS